MASPAPGPLGNEPRQPTRRALLWGARALGYLVYAYVVVTEIILGLGFILLLFGANPNPSFVDWVYRSMGRAMEPFRGIFPPIDLGSAANNEVSSVFDTSVLFAMIIYAIVAFAVHAFIEWLTHRIQRLDAQDAEFRRQLAWQQAARADQGQAATPRLPVPPADGGPPTAPLA
jgi:uncharacterized protein YggT (Ycf19 family)